MATSIYAIVSALSILSCGVLTPLMTVVGIATFAAGVATGINAAAEYQEGLTNFNFVRDIWFAGNKKAYDWYSLGIEAITSIGMLWIGGWLNYNAPRIQAYKNIKNYNIGKKHLPDAGGNWSKFITSNQNYLRSLGKEAIKNTSMKNLLYNSIDSYKIIYNTGRIIGLNGEMSVRLVFSKLGKIITFFPF